MLVSKDVTLILRVHTHANVEYGGSQWGRQSNMANDYSRTLHVADSLFDSLSQYVWPTNLFFRFKFRKQHVVIVSISQLIDVWMWLQNRTYSHPHLGRGLSARLEPWRVQKYRWTDFQSKAVTPDVAGLFVTYDRPRMIGLGRWSWMINLAVVVYCSPLVNRVHWPVDISYVVCLLWRTLGVVLSRFLCYVFRCYIHLMDARAIHILHVKKQNV